MHLLQVYFLPIARFIQKVQYCTAMMTHTDMVEVIRSGAAQAQISHAEASRRATGKEGVIKQMIRGHRPSAERLASICEAIGLEFYIGPRREQNTSPAPGGPDGMGTPTAATESALPEFATHHAVDVFPWPVRMEEGYSPTGCAWFGKDFLSAFEIHPDMCRVVMMFDRSMEPVLARGSNLLVDTGRAEPVDGLVYAIESDGGLLVRRARAGEDGWSFVAGTDSLPPIAGASATVVGQVVWAARLLGLGIDAADALKQMQGQH